MWRTTVDVGPFDDCWVTFSNSVSCRLPQPPVTALYLSSNCLGRPEEGAFEDARVWIWRRPDLGLDIAVEEQEQILLFWRRFPGHELPY